MRSSLPASRSARSTFSLLRGTDDWSSARCSAFSSSSGTWTGWSVKGSSPVWYMLVDAVPGVG